MPNTTAEKVKNWLNQKEAEQKDTPGFSKPAFTSEEVYEKVLDLQDKVTKVNRIPKPKPKIEKPVKNETESSREKADAANSSSEEGASQKEQTTSDAEKPSTNGKADAQSKDHESDHDEL